MVRYRESWQQLKIRLSLQGTNSRYILLLGNPRSGKVSSLHLEWGVHWGRIEREGKQSKRQICMITDLLCKLLAEIMLRVR